ncbi:MAG: glycoside hydrolase family 32 protein [Planctomycetes bacterium]|nr:glycoside hydrolase family 32 protein [Planctomycetota bacterium]
MTRTRQMAFSLLSLATTWLVLVDCRANEPAPPTVAPRQPPVEQATIETVRAFRQRMLADPHRPAYHFVVPEGSTFPFDPNGAIYWKGRYHLFYIFQDFSPTGGGHCWGHASSLDLLHWVHHPTALKPGDGDRGIFSGNAFINKEGIPTIAYAGIDSGMCLATAEDDLLNHWKKSPHNPVIKVKGAKGYEVGDPHVWLEGKTYYALTGSWRIPQGTGEALYLHKSQDLVHWEYLHPFYVKNPAWTGNDEDCSCADLFKLGNRHMLLCISHHAGARYYLGRYENERFVPEEHQRMNWPGGKCFAPETLLDGRGRRIMWAWVLESRKWPVQQGTGWSGVMTMPRVLSLDEKGKLLIDPPEEFTRLRYDRQEQRNLELKADAEVVLKDAKGSDVKGAELELALEIDPGSAKEIGVVVRRSPDGIDSDKAERTSIVYSPQKKTLTIDTSRSSLSPDITNDYPVIVMNDKVKRRIVRLQEAPLELAAGEPLRLRIYLDRSILEVYANRRQCITQRIYPTRKDSVGVALFSRGGAAQVRSVDAWQVMPTNAY